MGKRIILIISILLGAIIPSSCLTINDHYFDGPVYSIDARLQMYVMEFFQTCQKYIPKAEACMPHIDMDVYFKKLKPPNLGICTTHFASTYVTIKINTHLLNNPQKLKLVVFHELFHCVFDLDHEDSYTDIMNSSDEHQEEISKYMDFYVGKVFTRIYESKKWE